MADVSTVIDALKEVMDPELGRNLVDLGMVRDVRIQDDSVSVTIALTTPSCPLKGRIVESVRQRVLSIDGVSQVQVDLETMTPEQRNRALGAVDSNSKRTPSAKDLNHVRHVVAIMSGKGGVGKSLVTGLFGVALARRGQRVAILDADITGPSIPKMFGLSQRPVSTPAGIHPVQSELGIGVMSINLILDRDDDAVIWRGPLISNVIKQFWDDVLWGDLDCLLIDLPPGTADAPMTVLQTIPLSGVLVVTTPQSLASIIVRKAVRMTHQMSVPVLGIVENMSYFLCPDNGKEYEVFGPSRADEVARLAEAPVLGRLPLVPALAALCDSGRIEDFTSDAYDVLARAFIDAIEARTAEACPSATQ